MLKTSSLRMASSTMSGPRVEYGGASRIHLFDLLSIVVKYPFIEGRIKLSSTREGSIRPTQNASLASACSLSRGRSRRNVPPPECPRPERLLAEVKLRCKHPIVGPFVDRLLVPRLSASNASGGMCRGRREESVFGGPSTPSTKERRTYRAARSKLTSPHNSRGSLRFRQALESRAQPPVSSPGERSLWGWWRTARDALRGGTLPRTPHDGSPKKRPASAAEIRGSPVPARPSITRRNVSFQGSPVGCSALAFNSLRACGSASEYALD
jgi:hypothetical protein